MPAVHYNKAFFIAAGLLIGLIVSELLVILLLNDGHFIFSLDDPYIHLAMAENIWQGHYGVNLSEYSAPSSSIIWPLLLVPISHSFSASYSILFFNSLCGLATLWFFYCAVILSFNKQGITLSKNMMVAVLLLFILFSNNVGLIYTGMEHSLQVLLVVVIVWGLIVHSLTDQSPALLWFAMIIAPLVRFDCLAVSATALLYLFFCRLYMQALLAGLLILVALVSFSVFLLSLDLSYLPDSVLSKSGAASSGLQGFLQQLVGNMTYPKAMLMFLLSLFFLNFSMTNNNKQHRLMALVATLAIFMHLMAGRMFWFFRYEIYIWCFSFSLFAYLLLMYRATYKKWYVKTLIFSALFVAGIEHIVALTTTPWAANNIYSQQYQMHRFIRDYYQQDVAVNDLGLTSYRNDHYILDLWGLASGEARELRYADDGVEWMQALVNRYDVELIMIYHHPIWFAAVPDSWVKVAELDLVGVNITSLFPVSIFAVNNVAADIVRQKLLLFEPSLPGNTVLHLAPLIEH